MLLGCCHCGNESITESGSRGSSQSASANTPPPPGGNEGDVGCGACTLFPQRWIVQVSDFLQWNQQWVDYWQSWAINQGLTLQDCRNTFPIGGPNGQVTLEFDNTGAVQGGYKPKWRGPYDPGGYPGYYPAPVVVCGYWASVQNAFNLTAGCTKTEDGIETPIAPCSPAWIGHPAEPFAPWRDRIPQWEMIAYQPTQANPDRDWTTLWRLQFNYQYGCQQNANPFSSDTHGVAWVFAINRLTNNEPRASCVIPITMRGPARHCDFWDYPEHFPGAYDIKNADITITPA